MKKQLWLALTLAMTSSAAYLPQLAANQECCSETFVTLGSETYTYDIHFNALYLQPHASNLHYVVEAEPLPLPSPNWIINDIRPDYSFGFELGSRMFVPATNMLTSLNWTHFRSSDSNSRTAGTNDMVGPFFEIGPDAAAYTEAKGKVKFDYDSVTWDYGFGVNFGCVIKTHFFAGVEFASIKEKLTSTYSNDTGTISRTIESPSKFCGAGPRLGLDFNYEFCDSFAFNGCGAAALLVGELKNNTTYTSFAPDLPFVGVVPPNVQTTSVRHRSQVVPAFDGKLALAYNANICDCNVVFEAGYQARIYISAIQSVDMGSEVVTPPVIPDTIGVFARTFQRSVSNFAVAGPFVSMHVQF